MIKIHIKCVWDVEKLCFILTVHDNIWQLIPDQLQDMIDHIKMQLQEPKDEFYLIVGAIFKGMNSASFARILEYLEMVMSSYREKHHGTYD